MNNIFDFSHVTRIRHEWRDRLGTMVLPYKPDYPSINGTRIDDLDLVEEAQAHNALDKWIEYVVVYYTKDHYDEFKGERAKGIWRAWCERQFSKKGKKNENN